jgi:hypothetical protein
MSWRTAINAILGICAAGAAIVISGCGSSSANVVTIVATPSAATVIAGQVQTFTATVSGSTNTTVTNWPCTFSYTPPSTTANPAPKAVTGNCTSGQTISGDTGNIGTFTISTANGSNVLTYTAPSLANFPSPNIPTLTFTATADADHSKTTTATVTLDSGIRASITPTTATVPVGISPNQTAKFQVNFLNSPPVNAKFLLVQPNSASSNLDDQTASPLSDTCSPTCGTIDANGVYTAPGTLPTDTVPSGSKSVAPTTVIVVAWSAQDPAHPAFATITLINVTTNPVSFSGVKPTSIAAGGLLQDIFLDAKNLLNTSQIFFISPSSAANLSSAQVSPPLNNATQVFTIPISPAYCTPSLANVTPVVDCDASIVTRVRLTATQLRQAEPDPTQPAWIMIANLPGTPVVSPPCVLFPGSISSIACPLHIVNAGPALVASVPDSISQVAGTSSVPVGVDGGYYGVSGSLAVLTFAGQTVNLVNSSTPSGPRQLNGTTGSFQLPPPGLYEVTVNANPTVGAPPLFKTVSTNAAVQPNFATFSPNPTNSSSASCVDPTTGTAPLGGAFPICVPLPGGGNPAPSAIALNSIKGYAVIVEQGTSSLQLVNLTPTGPVLSVAPAKIVPAGNTPPAPTDIAIDTQLSANGGDVAAIVSSADSTLYLYSVNPQGTTPATVFTPLQKNIPLDLQTLLNEPTATGLATPVSIGVDPGTHLGVVAYSLPNLSTNIAFIVDINPNLDGSDTRACFLPGKVPPCVIGPVSVVTGPSPKVVMQPNVPLAYVTPGGGIGNTSVVDLLQQATSVQIAPFISGGTSGAVRTAGITTIVTTTQNGINPVLGGTVIISGVMGTKPNSNFNGTFQVLPGSVTPFTFSYAQPDQVAIDDVESNPSNALGTVQYGVAFFSLGTTTTTSGAAINPITQTFAYADYNQASGQIGFISTLDQSVTSLTLTAGSCANNCNPTPIGVSEIGFRSVAFDPFTNILVAYAPTANIDPNQNGNKISLINPGGLAAGGASIPPQRIIAATPTGQIGAGAYTPTGSSTPVSVFGPMAYDPKTKYILVANAGSNSLSYMSMDPSGSFQTAHIQDLQLPNPSCTNPADTTTCFGVPVAQPPLSTSAPAQAPTTCIPGSPTQPCMPQGVQVGRTAMVRILGQGFSSIVNPSVRLDGQTSITPPGQTVAVPITTTFVNDGEVDATIPAAALFAPHDFSVDIQSQAGGIPTNAIDLHVVKLLDMSPACATSKTFPQGPEGVAIDQSRRIALVTNYACNSVSVIAIDPNGFQLTNGNIAPYGTIIGNVVVGNNPIGVGILSRLAIAVVANSGDTPTGTASVIDISNPQNPQVIPITTTTTSGSTTTTTTTNSVAVGLSPLGVTVDQDHGLALVANNGSNTMTSIDLTVLLPSDASGSGHVSTSPTATTVALSGPPTAIAVDPNRAVAVVTNLQNSGTTSVTGGLDVVTLSSTPPLKSSTASVASLAASLTGIVYDPGDPNNTTSTTTGLFYATSTQANSIYAFNPDTGSAQTIRVGINPFSLGYNYQTGTLLTINSTSNSSSVVDVQNFKTRQTLGISSLSQFAIDVDNLTNIAVIVDQNNNRVVFLAMPH